MTTWNMCLLPDALSINSIQMILFHDLSTAILFLITMMTTLIILSIMMNKLSSRFILNNNKIEILWTIMPMIILIVLAMPSLSILYMMEDYHSFQLTVKAIGNQWFWTYEYSDFNNIHFSSYMLNNMSPESGSFRLLDVDNRMIIPFKTFCRILTTSTDVIHSFSVPALGIKIDSTPGRVNQSSLWIFYPSIFFGQCSEICGMNHSAMPIVIESTTLNSFKTWITFSDL